MDYFDDAEAEADEDNIYEDKRNIGNTSEHINEYVADNDDLDKLWDIHTYVHDIIRTRNMPSTILKYDTFDKFIKFFSNKLKK